MTPGQDGWTDAVVSAGWHTVEFSWEFLDWNTAIVGVDVWCGDEHATVYWINGSGDLK